jgi:hypothetical protein
MDNYWEYRGPEDDVEEDNSHRVFYCCEDCGRELIEGDTAYYVQTDPIGYTDRYTERRVVCRTCFRRHYGQDFLRSKVEL